MFGSQWLDNPSRGYDIDQSIRFNDGDSPYLTRTPGSGATDNRKFTVSMWLKRTTLTVDHVLFSTPTGNGRTQTYFDDSDKLNFGFYDGADNRSLVTNMQFRDTAAWYHVVWAFDIDNATAASRLRLYVNGSEADGTRNNPNTGVDSLWMNNGDVNDIGRQNPSTNAYFDGYMAEIHSIDGQALNGTSFGKTNGDGVWIPKKYSGAYGTNGFFIDGRDSSDLGDDESGNGNDFASSGLAANDQVSDSPTNNWCIMNSLSYDSTQITLSDGNLTLAWNTPNGDGGTTALSTFDISKHGKSYWEFSAANSSVNYSVGVCTNTSVWRKPRTQSAFAELRYGVQDASTASMQVTSGDGSEDDTGVLATTGSEVGMMAFDPASGKLWVGQDGTFFNSGDPAGGSNEQGTLTGTNNTGIYVNVRDFSSAEVGAVTFNFGQSGFAHTPPTGFTALNSANLPDPAIADPSAYFQTTLYEGDGSTQSIDQAGNSTFSPNLVWIKNRDATDAHALFDTVRGATEVLSSNSTAAEATNDDTLTAFESDGFAIGDDVIVNTNAESYVAWQWAEGATPGLDIIAYTGNGSNRTIAHNLGVKPGMFIVKARDRDDANWGVYHSAVGATKSLFLQSREAAFDSDEYFNDTEPTASVFTLGVNAQGNTDTKTYIAYVFAPVEGFSKFGSYIGNGNAYGPMVNLGFQPEFLLLKSTGDNKWIMKDTKRSPFNASSLSLVANNSDAELTGDSLIDINSNGFKLRTTGSGVNSSGVAYVYMAFAEHPFKTANAR
jgi:hypothetical protein